jgi:hypothetical protein
MEGRVEASLIMAGEEVWLWSHSDERFKSGPKGGSTSDSGSGSGSEGERKGEVFWLGLTAATGGIAQAVSTLGNMKDVWVSCAGWSDLYGLLW